MQVAEKSFLGTGWAFPPAFENSFKNAMVSDFIDIEQSIFIILNTTPGERLMQPEFGCDLKRLVFEIVNSAFVNELQDLLKMALLRFEPRVNFETAEVTTRNEMEGVLFIRIYYTVIITNTRHNIVYPFYLNEGTNILIPE